MANITQWPSTPLDGDQWERNTWDIGTPITKEKLENLEEGIAVLATQMRALLNEFEVEEIDPTTIQLNSSRLDTIQTWITALEDGTYDFSKGSIASRLQAIETTDKTQERALTAIKNELGGTFSDNGTTASFTNSYLKQALNEIYGAATPVTPSFITSLIGELGATGNHSNNGWTNSKLKTAIADIEKNNKKIIAIAGELGGGTPDGTSTTYPIAATRLDDLEKEICGNTITRDTTNGGYTNSRIDKIQTWITGSNSDSYSGETISTRFEAIEEVDSGQNELLENIELVNTQQNERLDAIDLMNEQQNEKFDAIELVDTAQNSRLTALENELSGSGSGTSGTSRLDNLQKWIAGTPTSNYDGTTIATRLDTLQNDNTTNKSDIANIINEIGGTYSTSTGFTNSQVSKIPSIMEKNDTQDSNIGKIKVEIWGENKDYSDTSRIDDLSDRMGIVASLSTSNQSRISSAESRIRRIEDGAIAAKILNYTTVNSENSDSLILPADSLIDQNSIIMIFLNVSTLGVNDLTIQDSENLYNIKINSNINLRARFTAGSLLGIYRGETSDIYMFNAPLAI